MCWIILIFNQPITLVNPTLGKKRGKENTEKDRERKEKSEEKRREGNVWALYWKIAAFGLSQT